MKNKILRAASLSLALLMLLPAALTGCKPSSTTDDTTTSTEAPTATESLPIETETAEPDAFENTLLLAADGQTAYTVIVPDYAADWELTAAERLVKTLADLQSRVLQAPNYEFFWLERCRRGYNLITTRNKGALDKGRELAPEMTLYGVERNLHTFYFEDEQGKLFKHYDGELRQERSDNQ